MWCERYENVSDSGSMFFCRAPEEILQPPLPETESKHITMLKSPGPVPDSKVQVDPVLKTPEEFGDGDRNVEREKGRPPKRARTSKSDKFLSYPVISTRRTVVGVERAIEEKVRKQTQDRKEGRLKTGVVVGKEVGGGGGVGSGELADSEGGGKKGAGKSGRSGDVRKKEREDEVERECREEVEEDVGEGRRGMGDGGGGVERERRNLKSGEETAVEMGREESMRDTFADSFLDSLVPQSRRPEVTRNNFGTESRMGDEGVKTIREGGVGAESEEILEGKGGVGLDGDGGGLVGGGQLGRRGEVDESQGIDLDGSRYREEVVRDYKVQETRNDEVVVNTANVSLPSGGVGGGGKKVKIKISYKDLVKDLLR